MAQMMYTPFSMNPAPTQQPDAKIHISDLHESITEEILWQEFKTYGTIQSVRVPRTKEGKSKKYGKITFINAGQAKDAINLRNLTYLIDAEVPGQKRIRVSKDIPIDRLTELKKSNLFIKGIPESLDQKIIYNHLTKFGEIHSLYISTNPKTGKNTGYGFVLYETKEQNEAIIKQCNESQEKYESLLKEGNQQAIEAFQNEDKFYIEGSRWVFSEFVDSAKREKAEYNNYFVRDFSSASFSGSNEEKEKTLQVERANLEKVFSKFGNIKSLIITLDEKTQKPFAFCAMENNIEVEDLKKEFKQPEVYINKVESKKSSKKVVKQENRFFILKNLTFHEDEAKAEEFQKQCRDILSKFGEVVSFKMNKGVKPKDKADLEESCNAILVFKTEKEGNDFLFNHLNQNDERSRELKSIFINENAHGNATILLPKSERRRMVNMGSKSIKQNQINFQQQMYATTMQKQQQQMMQTQQQFRGPMQQPNRNMGQRNRGFQQNQNQNKKPVTQAPKPAQQQQAQQAAQQPANQASQQQGNVTLEQLKENLGKFTQLEQSKQSQILGNLIYPKVKKLVEAKGQPESLAPKITGMLIDFSVFDVSDIMDILENEEDLKERVSEAIELIKQQN